MWTRPHSATRCRVFDNVATSWYVPSLARNSSSMRSSALSFFTSQFCGVYGRPESLLGSKTGNVKLDLKRLTVAGKWIALAINCARAIVRHAYDLRLIQAYTLVFNSHFVVSW